MGKGLILDQMGKHRGKRDPGPSATHLAPKEKKTNLITRV